MFAAILFSGRQKFNGSDRETPLPPSKASKTHPNISNTLHPHAGTVHIHHARDIVTVGENIKELVVLV